MPKSKVDDMPFVIPSDLVDNQRPILFGRTALQRLVKQNAIRPAKPADLQAWVNAGVGKPGLHADFSDLDLERTYVVMAPFQLPLGLIGNASSAFIVPPGRSIPKGGVGENMVMTTDHYGCFWSGGFFGNCAGFSPP